MLYVYTVACPEIKFYIRNSNNNNNNILCVCLSRYTLTYIKYNRTCEWTVRNNNINKMTITDRFHTAYYVRSQSNIKLNYTCIHKQFTKHARLNVFITSYPFNLRCSLFQKILAKIFFIPLFEVVENQNISKNIFKYFLNCLCKNQILKSYKYLELSGVITSYKGTIKNFGLLLNLS